MQLSDLAEIFQMASKGRVYLFGNGQNRINPIHGVILAVACADALDDERRTIDVVGPPAGLVRPGRRDRRASWRLDMNLPPAILHGLHNMETRR